MIYKWVMEILEKYLDSILIKFYEAWYGPNK